MPRPLKCGPSEAKKEGERLAKDAFASIMRRKRAVRKSSSKKISKFFVPGTSAQKVEDMIIKALELYCKRQREMER